MWLKERAYRLPVALLVLMALVASVPLMASAEEEETEYLFDFVECNHLGGNVFRVTGTLDGDDFTGLEVVIEGAVSGTDTSLGAGAFAIDATGTTGSADAVLKDQNGNELARESFSADL